MGKEIFMINVASEYVVDNVFGDDYYGNHFEGSNETDTVWSDEQSAWIRIKRLANEFIEKVWYSCWLIPGKDYQEEWSEEDLSVIFKFYGVGNVPDDIPVQQSFFACAMNVDPADPSDDSLPAYFTTT